MTEASASDGRFPAENRGSVRRGMARLVVIAVVVAEVAVPYTVVPLLERCCVPKEIDWLVIWAVLALVIPAFAVVSWSATLWVVDGFAGAPAAASRPAGDVPPSAEAGIRNPIAPDIPKDAGPLRWIWPDVSTPEGRRTCALYGYAALAWIMIGHVLNLYALYDVTRMLVVSSGDVFTLRDFAAALGSNGFRWDVGIAILAPFLMVVAWFIPRRAFAAALTLATLEFARTVLIKQEPIAGIASAIPIVLALQALRGSYSSTEGR